MPFCTNCGKEVPENTKFCPNCGTQIGSLERLAETTPYADWWIRFIAWLIDIAIVGVFSALIAFFVFLPTLSLLPIGAARNIPFLNFGPSSWISFLYWMFTDVFYGQSIGRMIMGIRITRLDGGPINMGQAAIESVGKAFLLPIDFLLGFFLYPKKKQRMFNYLSNTIVVYKHIRSSQPR